MTEPLVNFKDMCARFDVTPRTLRYYEYIELLRPTKQGRARFYGPREIARMKLILRGRHFGFGLEEIRQWLEMYENHGTVPQLEAFIEMAGRQLLEMERKQAELLQLRKDLEELRGEAQKDLERLGRPKLQAGAK